MDFQFGVSESDYYDTTWAFFNDASGNLLAVVEPDIGSNKMYTEATFEEEFIYYTLTRFQTNGGNIAHSLINGTNKVQPGEKREEFQLNTIPQNETVEIEINRLDLVNEWSKYTARGTKYRPISFSSTSAPSYSEIFEISYSDPEIVYIRTTMANAGLGFDGKKENYLYYKLIPEPQTTQVFINEADFTTMDDFQIQAIPVHDYNSLNFTRMGYESESDMLDDVSHTIFEVLEDFDRSYTDYFDLPLLEGFDYYKNIARYYKDGNRVYVEQFGNSLDLNAPEWSIIDSGKNGDSYYVNAENSEVDYYFIRLSKSSSTFNPRKSVSWVYRTFGNGEGDNSTPVLSIPEQITTSLGDTYYSQSDLRIEYVGGVDFQEIDSYLEAMDYLSLGKLQLKTNEKGYTSVRFLNTASGKSDTQGSDPTKIFSETNY